jgi:hypothetical protein
LVGTPFAQGSAGDNLDIEIRHHERQGVDAALLNNRHLVQTLFAGMTTRIYRARMLAVQDFSDAKGISDYVATGKVAGLTRPDACPWKLQYSAVMDGIQPRWPNARSLALETIVGTPRCS